MEANNKSLKMRQKRWMRRNERATNATDSNKKVFFLFKWETKKKRLWKKIEYFLEQPRWFWGRWIASLTSPFFHWDSLSHKTQHALTRTHAPWEINKPLTLTLKLKPTPHRSLAETNMHAHTHTLNDSHLSLSHTHTHLHNRTSSLCCSHKLTKIKPSTPTHAFSRILSLYLSYTLSWFFAQSHTQPLSLSLSHISQTPATHQPTSHTKHTSTQYLSMSEPIAYRNESLA